MGISIGVRKIVHYFKWGEKKYGHFNLFEMLKLLNGDLVDNGFFFLFLFHCCVGYHQLWGVLCSYFEQNEKFVA
jgi:hypothetical protein